MYSSEIAFYVVLRQLFPKFKKIATNIWMSYIPEYQIKIIFEAFQIIPNLNCVCIAVFRMHFEQKVLYVFPTKSSETEKMIFSLESPIDS